MRARCTYCRIRLKGRLMFGFVAKKWKSHRCKNPATKRYKEHRLCTFHYNKAVGTFGVPK